MCYVRVCLCVCVCVSVHACDDCRQWAVGLTLTSGQSWALEVFLNFFYNFKK